MARLHLPLMLAAAVLAVPLHAQYETHARVPELLQRLHAEHGFNAVELSQVRAALREAQRLPQLVEQEQKAPERTETWTRYSRRIDEARISGGLRLLNEHPEMLARAEAEFGVPPTVIAAVLGIETRYGNITGNIRVLDALATQGFDHPTRSPFFLSELTEFFAFCRDFGRNPATPLGSYAGAMGAAQFMPSNYRRLALDYNGDGQRDLWNLADAIGSIAHYFTAYDPARRWRRGEPLILPAKLSTGVLPQGAQVNGRMPAYYAGDLARAGIHSQPPLPPQTVVGLIELPLDDDSREYWIALPNFYAVMSYNPRVFYAMAVAQLAQRIESRAREAVTP